MTEVVLVIDDNEGVRTALSILFSVHELPCITAATVEEGLGMLEEHAVGLVVQDMNFSADTTSGKEGVALFHEIRGRYPDLPIILLTAWTHLESAVELVRAGAADYLATHVSGLPERGDIVIFKHPQRPRVDYVKRVIALPGDTFAMSGGRYRGATEVHRRTVLIGDDFDHIRIEIVCLRFDRHRGCADRCIREIIQQPCNIADACRMHQRRVTLHVYDDGCLSPAAGCANFCHPVGAGCALG